MFPKLNLTYQRGSKTGYMECRLNGKDAWSTKKSVCILNVTDKSCCLNEKNTC